MIINIIFSPEELLQISPFYLEGIELDPMVAAEVFFGNDWRTSIILALIERDPSFETVNENVIGAEKITRLYRQICNEQGKPLLIKFIKTLKGLIPDDVYKRNMIEAWQSIVSWGKDTTGLLNYFFFNNLLSISELMEISFMFGSSNSDELLNEADMFAGHFQPSENHVCDYWKAKFNFFSNHYSANYTVSLIERKFVRQFLNEENWKRGTLNPEQIQVLDQLAQLQITDEESVTVPSIYSPAMPPSLPTSSEDKQNENPLKGVKFIIICGDSQYQYQFIEVDGEIASLSNYFRMSYNYRRDPYKEACPMYEKMGLSPYKAANILDENVHIVDLRNSDATYQRIYFAINHLKMLLGLDYNLGWENLGGLNQEELLALIRATQFLLIDLPPKQ